MKTPCLALSLYVLFLSTGPCCLDDNCKDKIETAYANNNPQEHNEGDCSTCIPFLTCGTCSGVVITGLQIDIIDFPSHNNKSFAGYKSHFSNKFFNEIWQPPKIS